MSTETETPIKIPYFAKDIVDNIRSTRRSKINGKSTDKKQLSQSKTIFLVLYYFVVNNERYKELLQLEFNDEIMKKITQEYNKNV